MLTEVMNLMLSPVLAAGGQPTILMKLCLASMAVVFPERVQLEAVHLLWGQLLRTEPYAINELGDLTPNQLRKRVRFISEALTSVGLLSIAKKDGVPFVEIYHGLQWEYALMLGREMHFGGSPSKAASRWHEAFASAYLNKKVEADREGGEDVCRIYALENLLQHMLKAGMYQKVAVLLRDDRFLNERLDLLDWTKAAECHIRDCKSLQAAMDSDESISADAVDVAVAIYTKAGGLVLDQAQASRKEAAPKDCAMALQQLGFALMDLGRHSEAISQYKSALKQVPKGTALAASILYSLAAVYIARNDHKKGLNNVKECLKVLQEIGESTTLYAEALILRGDSMMTTCDYKGALDSYDRALDNLFADSDNCRVEIGIALGRKGRLYQVMGEMENAHGALDECLKWKLKINESSCDLASIYNFLGDLCMDRDEKKKALDFFDAAYRLFEQHRNEADETDIHLINGKTDYLNSDFSGSQESFKLALESMEKKVRPLMDRTAYDYRTIAKTFLKQGDFGQAKGAFDKCLDATNDRRDESLERSAALFDMGNLYVNSKETKSAFPCFEDSLKIRIVKLGPSETVIDAMEKIGSLHKQVGEREDALNYFNKALELTEKVHGEDSPKVAEILYKFGELKEEMDEHVEALAMLGECLDIQRRHLPGRHPDIASTVDALGKIHLEKHNYEKAYQLFIEGLEIRQANFQPDDPRVGDSFHNLGVVSRKGGKCDRALTFLMEALHVRKSLEDESFTVETLLEIGNVHRALGDPESALGCYEKCLEITLDRYGGEDERISDILLPLGHAKKDLGFAEDAVDFYRRALEIREKKCGKDSAKCAAGFRSLGLVMYEKGDYRAAIKYLVDFIRIQDARKQKNSIDYVMGLEIIGDIHKFNNNAEDAISAFAAASNAYRQNKELSKLYPALGGFLEKRLAAEEKQNPDQEQAGGLLDQITGALRNLDNEVKMNDMIEASPEEEAFRRKLIFDG
uniref:Anaphase-promoting complex subunit 5 domain-containing protein n=1 Tax=Grammatophora oceanica TaxID=210454 RepID=A0A7S1USR9_9STRA